MKQRRAREFRARGDSGEEVIVRGVQPTRFRDVYHRFLRASWPAALGALVFAFLAVNAVFAAVYMNVGGVAGARPGSFFDAFAFSVETMATIGYGAMHPESPVAHVLVIVQAIVGLLSTALVTGLVFTKFSQSTARIVFSDRLALAPMNGVPTLTFRVGNDRENRILEATVRVSLVRTEQTKEGSTFYRTYDLPLVRERSPALSRSFTAMHPVVPGSLLHGKSPEDLEREEVELLVTLVGTDDTSLQPVHARKRYTCADIVFGARLADVLSVSDDGLLVFDMTHFHDLEPSEPTDDFPYPSAKSP